LSLGRRKSRREIENAHHSTFLTWLVEHVQKLKDQGIVLPDEVVTLAMKPYMMARKYSSNRHDW